MTSRGKGNTSALVNMQVICVKDASDLRYARGGLLAKSGGLRY
jgi:hypothetical protein